MSPESQVRRLAERDEDLARLAADVTDLHTELVQLRTHGVALTRQLAQDDTKLSEQQVALERVEQERTAWQQRAEAATTALRRAEAGLAAQQQDVALRDDELRILRVRVHEQERLLHDVQSEQAARESDEGQAEDSNHRLGEGHVLIIALATGYELGFSDEPCPSPGERVMIDGRWFTVERTGRSPLPRDGRPCALVMAERQ